MVVGIAVLTVPIDSIQGGSFAASGPDEYGCGGFRIRTGVMAIAWYGRIGLRPNLRQLAGGILVIFTV